MAVCQGPDREEGRAQDVLCDLREALYSAPIIALAIGPGERLAASTTTAEPCLTLRVTRSYDRAEGRRWELAESRLFTFAEAVFREVPPG
jgi:hypothetical protein